MCESNPNAQECKVMEIITLDQVYESWKEWIERVPTRDLVEILGISFGDYVDFMRENYIIY